MFNLQGKLIKSCEGVQHKLENDVASLDVSEYLGLVATGSFQGTILIWDFEFLKLCAAISE